MLPLIADSAAFFLLTLPLIADNLKVDALCACVFAFMLPLIADSAAFSRLTRFPLAFLSLCCAFFLLMLPLIADSAALWLQKARQPKG